MKQIAIIDNGTDCLSDLVDLCCDGEHDYSVLPASSLNDENMHEYDCVVLSGGVWYQDAELQARQYERELAFIRQANIPIIGVCLGMQLILSSFGGEFVPLTKPAIGEKTVRLTQSGIEQLHSAHELTVTENHTIGATKTPGGFELLGYSDDCIEIVRHKRLPIIGVQFHPEKGHRKSSPGLWHSLLAANHRR